MKWSSAARAAAGFMVVWGGIGTLSRIEWIGRKALLIWRLTTVDLNLAVNLVMLFGAGGWLVYDRLKTRPPSGSEPIAPASATERALLNRALSELAALSVGQKIALAVIYRQPGHFVGLLNTKLQGLGFVESGAIVTPLLTTVLISVDGRHNVNTSHYPIVSSTVELFLEQTTLAKLW